MATAHEPTPGRPLRLWPGVVAAVLMVLVRFILPVVAPEAQFFGVDALLVSIFGGLVGALAIIVWWMFFSRARWFERLGAIVVMIIAVVVTFPLTHVSIQNGMMGMMFYVYAVPPTLSLAFVCGLVASRRLSEGPRRLAIVGAILLGCGVWTLVRTNGIFGGASDLTWRWTPTAEDRLLARGDEPLVSARGEPVDSAREHPPAAPPAPEAAEAPGGASKAEADEEPAAVPAAPSTTKAEPPAPAAANTDADWPGFRGPRRDSVIRDVTIETDWSKSPPVQLWRRPIGPGWSSFAVRGDLIYTQEQRGEDEIVSCYRLTTGEPVWRHRDPVRFWESNGGAGPRATPTLAGDRVYTLGATGILNALDAATGAVAWSRNAAADTGKEIPGWGLASSPLVIGDLVVVGVSGRLAAYDSATGNPRWLGETGGGGYSSPHYASIGGVPQVLLARGGRTISVAPADGTLLWDHKSEPATSIVQPAFTGDGDVLIAACDAMGGLGIRRIAVAHGPAGWNVDERWTSRGLKPYFNDFVVHEGHAFGFDGSILACIDVADGTRKWKGGRFGNGQLVLLPDQDMLLVLSEDGELALVSATPDQFTEVARFPVLDGKTWNHPALVGDVLLVRNGEEMAAFRLPLADR